MNKIKKIKLLKKIHKLTNNRYVEVKDRKCKDIVTGEVIPVKHLAYKQLPEPGIYLVTFGNCGEEECKLDSPKRSCVEDRIYDSIKCAKYYPDSLNSITLSYSKLFELLHTNVSELLDSIQNNILSIIKDESQREFDNTVSYNIECYLKNLKSYYEKE